MRAVWVDLQFHFADHPGLEALGIGAEMLYLAGQERRERGNSPLLSVCSDPRFVRGPNFSA